MDINELTKIINEIYLCRQLRHFIWDIFITSLIRNSNKIKKKHQFGIILSFIFVTFKIQEMSFIWFKVYFVDLINFRRKLKVQIDHRKSFVEIYELSKQDLISIQSMLI